MAATGEGLGFTDLGIIGEKAPVHPDEMQTSRYRTPSTAGPTLTRTSMNQQSALSRNSASTGSPRAGAMKPLARVSAQQFPNLSRASMGAASGGSALSRGSMGLARSSVAKTQQEISRRAAEYITECLLTISLHDKTANKPVVYKTDGTRFAQSEHTVKLQEGHVYTIRIQAGNDLRVVEGSVFLAHTNKAGAPMKDALDAQVTSKGAEAEWTCRSKVSGKGDRNCMELALEVADFGVCLLPLSAKVYGAGQTRAAQSGMALKSVIAKFKKGDDEAVRLKMQQWLHS